MSNPSGSGRGFRYWFNAWLPVLLGIAVIAIETSTDFGADHTSRPLRWIWESFFGYVPNHEWELIHHYIRKCGHFLGYGVISLAWLHAWWLTFHRWRFFHCSWMALIFTALMASLDEFHQAFEPNRTGMFRDVLLDCFGALVLQLLAWLALRLLRSRELRRRESYKQFSN